MVVPAARSLATSGADAAAREMAGTRSDDAALTWAAERRQGRAAPSLPPAGVQVARPGRINSGAQRQRICQSARWRVAAMRRAFGSSVFATQSRAASGLRP